MDVPTSILPRRSKRRVSTAFDLMLTSREGQDFAEALAQHSHEFNVWAQATQGRRGEVAQRFVKMHQHGRWQRFSGREFDGECIVERAKDFLTIAVQVSVSRQGEDQKMAWSTLVTLRWDLLGLMNKYCPDAEGNKTLTTRWETELYQHACYIAKVMDLSFTPTEKMYFGVPEWILLAETALANTHCVDNTLQHMLLWLLMLYLAGRPGSFLATDDYPEWFMKIRHIVISRTGVLGEFDVEVSVVAWKGGHNFDRWVKKFRLVPIKDANHMLLDVGLVLIVVALRRGLFQDHTSLDSVLLGRERVLRWKPEVMDLPLFAASAPRGLRINPHRAMHYDASRVFLKRICAQTGMDATRCTTYCFRRGSATTFNRIFGGDLAKSIMHHKHTSETLYTHYANDASQANVVACIIGGRAEHVIGKSPADAPALHRADISHHRIEQLSLGQALAMSEELRLIYMQKAMLKECMVEGVEELDDASVDSLSEDDRNFWYDMSAREDGISPVVALYEKLRRRGMHLFSDMKERYWKYQYASARKAAPALTVDDLEQRLHEQSAPRDMLHVVKALLQSEDDTSRSNEVISCASLMPAVAEDTLPQSELTRMRVEVMRYLVDYTLPHTGAQACPYCGKEVSCRAKLDIHIGSHVRQWGVPQELTHSLYTDFNEGIERQLFASLHNLSL